MMKVNKPKHIYCETLQINFYVSYGVSVVYWAKQVGEFSDYKRDLEIGGSVCGTVESVKVKGDTFYWIWTKERSLDDYAHECFHAIVMALDWKGIRMCDASEEVYAYLLARLMREWCTL